MLFFIFRNKKEFIFSLRIRTLILSVTIGLCSYPAAWGRQLPLSLSSCWIHLWWQVAGSNMHDDIFLHVSVGDEQKLAKPCNHHFSQASAWIHQISGQVLKLDKSTSSAFVPLRMLLFSGNMVYTRGGQTCSMYEPHILKPKFQRAAT